MAVPLVHTRGWLDTLNNLQIILKSDEFLTKLVTRNASIPLIKAEEVDAISATTQILSGAKYLAHGKGVKDQDYVKALVLGELMAPVLPASMSLDTSSANKEFDLICKYLLNNETVYNRGKTSAQWIAEIRTGNENVPEENRLRVPIPPGYTRDDYQHYLLWLAYKLPKPQYMNALQLVVTSYVGAAKRGNVSERFIDKT